MSEWETTDACIGEGVKENHPGVSCGKGQQTWTRHQVSEARHGGRSCDEEKTREVRECWDKACHERGRGMYVNRASNEHSQKAGSYNLFVCVPISRLLTVFTYLFSIMSNRLLIEKVPLLVR